MSYDPMDNEKLQARFSRLEERLSALENRFLSAGPNTAESKLSTTEKVILMLAFGMGEAEVKELIGGTPEDIKLVWDEIQRVRSLVPDSKRGKLYNMWVPG